MAITACEKKPQYESELINFNSVTADQDTLLVGESAKLTAIAEGNNVTYNWEASTGDLLGSGNVVYYLAGICSVGTNIIRCTVIGDNRSESKTVTIVVL
jgi:hypothetical protein